MARLDFQRAGRLRAAGIDSEEIVAEVAREAEGSPGPVSSSQAITPKHFRYNKTLTIS
jgi:hypothetical protein